MIISVMGVGFVGGAVAQVLTEKGHEVRCYDKYKQVGKIEDVLDTDMIFLCLPTPFVEGHGYDLTAIKEACNYLSENQYIGPVILKSTVEPGATRWLWEHYGLKLIHNPEFLTARTAVEDFRNQQHIVLGTNDMSCRDDTTLYSMYRELWPHAKISCCTWEESETMKIAANTFYAIKVAYWNEIFFLSQKMGADYNKVRDMVVANGWMTKDHTNVPGPDGNYYYGGACFPKDSSALNLLMEREGVLHGVIDACIKERNKIRKD